ncbi:hypothetical protein PR048_032436 [Dryococelus australis]|uniref:Uncharacterized protein n=1 Tax=Dryococelus australis TaxID=614101 RepID=A0ABQ9G564_9NEOP|nr:hypothetical protein PR048_032436 [Dryococelus australis]
MSGEDEFCITHQPILRQFLSKLRPPGGGVFAVVLTLAANASHMELETGYCGRHVSFLLSLWDVCPGWRRGEDRHPSSSLAGLYHAAAASLFARPSRLVVGMCEFWARSSDLVTVPEASRADATASRRFETAARRFENAARLAAVILVLALLCTAVAGAELRHWNTTGRGSGVRIGDGRPREGLKLGGENVRPRPEPTTTPPPTPAPKPPTTVGHGPSTPPPYSRSHRDSLQIGVVLPKVLFGLREYTKKIMAVKQMLQKTTRGRKMERFSEFGFTWIISMKTITPSPTSKTLIDSSLTVSSHYKTCTAFSWLPTSDCILDGSEDCVAIGHSPPKAVSSGSDNGERSHTCRVLPWLLVGCGKTPDPAVQWPISARRLGIHVPNRWLVEGVFLQAASPRAVNLLASPRDYPGSIPCKVTPDFRMCESCRTIPLVGGFSRGSPVSPCRFIPVLLNTHSYVSEYSFSVLHVIDLFSTARQWKRRGSRRRLPELCCVLIHNTRSLAFWQTKLFPIHNPPPPLHQEFYRLLVYLLVRCGEGTQFLLSSSLPLPLDSALSYAVSSQAWLAGKLQQHTEAVGNDDTAMAHLVSVQVLRGWCHEEKDWLPLHIARYWRRSGAICHGFWLLAGVPTHSNLAMHSPLVAIAVLDSTGRERACSGDDVNYRCVRTGVTVHSKKYRGRDGVVVRLLALYQGEPGSISSLVAPGFSHVGVVSKDVTDWRISSFPRPCIPGAAPCSPRFTFVGSQDLDVESLPGLFTVHPLLRNTVVLSFTASFHMQILLLASCTRISPRRLGLDSIRGYARIFSHETRAGLCRWSACFLRDLQFLLPTHSAAPPYSFSFTLIGSQDLAVEIRSTGCGKWWGDRGVRSGNGKRGVRDVAWLQHPCKTIGT